jgi:hypothetical protein
MSPETIRLNADRLGWLAWELFAYAGLAGALYFGFLA